MAQTNIKQSLINVPDRRPRGRLIVPITARRIPRSVSLPHALWSQLELAAQAEGVSVSYITELAILAMLSDKKGGAL